MSDIADKLIDTAYFVDGMLLQYGNLIKSIPTLMRDAAIDIRDIETENAKLRELVRVILSDMDAWQMVIASGDTGYGKGCLERLYDLRDQAHELGVKLTDGD